MSSDHIIRDVKIKFIGHICHLTFQLYSLGKKYIFSKNIGTF